MANRLHFVAGSIKYLQCNRIGGIMVKNREFFCIKYRSEYRVSTLKLLGDIWKGLDAKDVEGRFEWRYELNPLNGLNYAYIAVSDDNVVGFRAYVPQVFKKDDILYNIFSPADSIVSADYRRLGVFSKLTKCLIDDIAFESELGRHDIILNLSANKYSSAANLKMGWQRIKGRKFLHIHLNFTKLLTVYSKRVLENIEIKKNTYRDMSIEVSQRPRIEEMAKLSSKIEKLGKFCNRRDENFLEWRYKENSVRLTYLYIYRMGKLASYAVLKNKYRLIYSLFDYDFDSEDSFSLLISEGSRLTGIPIIVSTQYSNKKSCRIKSFWTIQGKLLSFLKIDAKCGFLVRPASEQLSSKSFRIDGCDITDIDNWIIKELDIH